MSSSLHFDTLASYRAAGRGEVVLPDQTATGVDNGYGLQGNQTMHELQDAISALENGQYTLLYPSGSTALCALSALLKAGDHWLLPDSVYYPMRRFADYMQKNYGINCDYYDALDIAALEGQIKPETRLIHIETPSSATFDVTDVEAIVRLANANKIITSADNTWASGVLYKPLNENIDISILSLTKYIAGYSDVFMGSITTNDKNIYDKISYHHRVLGYTVSPFSAMLVNRGLESLAVRIAAHGDNASKLVDSVKGHTKITSIYQAGIEQGFNGSNGSFSIQLDRYYSDAELEKALTVLKVFKIGESWGGTRSLVLPFQPEEFNQRFRDYPNTIIRFHSGLEDLEKQKSDIANFLSALG